jgi:hypothetical protein
MLTMPQNHNLKKYWSFMDVVFKLMKLKKILRWVKPRRNIKIISRRIYK